MLKKVFKSFMVVISLKQRFFKSKKLKGKLPYKFRLVHSYLWQNGFLPLLFILTYLITVCLYLGGAVEPTQFGFLQSLPAFFLPFLPYSTLIKSFLLPSFLTSEEKSSFITSVILYTESVIKLWYKWLLCAIICFVGPFPLDFIKGHFSVKGDTESQEHAQDSR